MARLPTVGGDDGNWGTLLNDFLSQAHNSDGSLKGVLSAINVKDYGAKGDGTTDDTAAIETALAAVPAGGILFFSPGRYITQGGHVIDKPMTIIGSGRHQYYNSSAQLVLKNGANADMFTLAASAIVLRDLMLYGNSNNQSATSRGIVCSLTSGSNYFLLDDIWIDSFNGDGIVCQSPASTLSGIISACEIRLCNGYGLNIAGTASDIAISDCYIDQNVQSGVYLSASDASFSNCHIWGNGTGASGNRDGVTMQSSAANRFVNCYLESNTNGFGIRTTTGTNTGHQIIGCYIYNNGLNGIYLFNADHCVINGNHVYKNNYKASSGQNGAGIVLDTCTAIVTTGNVIRNSGTKRQTYGYYEVGTTCTDCRFADNISRAVDHTTGGVLFGASTRADLGDYFRYKTADQSVTSSTTLVDDIDLTFPVAVGEVYEIEGVLFVEGSQTGDLQLRMDTPTGMSGYWQSLAPNASAASTTATSIMPVGNAYNTQATVGMLGTGVIVPVTIRGLLIVGTAGNAKVRWAQGTSDATATIVHAGSYLRARRVSQ